MIIMKGDTFTGGLSTMDVRTDGNEEEDGLLVEVMVHEGTHASLDPYIYNIGEEYLNDKYEEAVESDNAFVTEYATTNNGLQEDVADK